MCSLIGFQRRCSFEVTARIPCEFCVPNPLDMHFDPTVPCLAGSQYGLYLIFLALMIADQR